ncbi:sodium-dependent transporter [Clostridium sp. MSJ-4]|uniref:Transporter n=1 Tax=Clostridium simiarum TaxID=2841506 RepID=A0ABS6EXN0_9CLOT|nr:sodium-dependent transporter [Clostridium simiarum]MBU5590890.1 sodium-dependent transporter [Clostridium simiarum]
MKRDNFGSKLGVVAAAAGSAIGLGNIWKFPYITGVNGGAAFILVYLLCIFLIGIPVMLSEFALGRKNQVNAVETFKKLKPNSKWHLAGYLSVLTAFIILSFYSMIAGWVFSYILRSITGSFNSIPVEKLSEHFTTLISNPWEPLAFTLLVLVITAIVVFSGIQSGIEKFSKIVMPLLVVLILILMVRSFTLQGAYKGIEFLFKPDFSQLKLKGVLEALGHSFYTLSLGMAIILTYGSYIKKDVNLVSLSIQVALADTLIALMAGMVIFPAVFAYGLEPTYGPGLIFVTLPAVFKSMPFGNFFEFLFFILIAIAAITSTVSLMEAVVAFVSEKFKLTRGKSTVIILVLLYLLAIPSILSLGPLAGFKIGGKVFFDAMDFITSNIFLPIGGIVVCIFVGWIWGADKAVEEITSDGVYNFKFRYIYSILVRYIAPIAILFIFLYSLGIIKI